LVLALLCMGNQTDVMYIHIYIHSATPSFVDVYSGIHLLSLFISILFSFIYGPSSLPCNSVAGCCRGDHGVRVRDVLACRAQCSANTVCFAAKLYMSIGLLESTVLVLLLMDRRQITEKKSSGVPLYHPWPIRSSNFPNKPNTSLLTKSSDST
jgi:hypothetical protein